MARILALTFLCVALPVTRAMIMRNNALMSKMVSQFQGKESNRPHDRPLYETERTGPSEDAQEGTSEHVMSLMQNVLCKNFPSVPCELITKDETLRNLIEKSIQQLKYKKMTMAMERSTSPPNYQLTLFPVITSEDISNFLSVSNTGFFKQKKTRRKTPKNVQEKNYWSHEKRNRSKAAVFNGRKTIRKFYPHKIKYKDKQEKRDFNEYSEEKLSMSVEAPREQGRRRHLSYRGQPSDPPVWRIDYMKHGEPSLNMFGYEPDTLKEKIIKTGPNVLVDDSILEQAARREVLHPDVYIKNSYPGKNNRHSSDNMR